MGTFTRNLRRKILKLTFDHKKRKELELDKVSRILFSQYSDKIGDSIANTHVFRELRKKYPNLIIDVLCRENNSKILLENPHISNLIVYEGFKTLLGLRKNSYDIFYFHNEDLYHLEDYILLNVIKADLNIGRNKQEFNIIDYSINGDFSNVREIDKYNAFLEVLNIKPKEEKYDIYLTEEEIRNGKKYIDKNRKNIVFNRYGANKRRTFNEEKTHEILEAMFEVDKEINLILVSPPSKREELVELKNNFSGRNIIIPEINTIRETSAIIFNSDLVISPETSIVHIACAFRKPQISIYRRKNILWHPITEESTVIYSKNKNKKDVNYIQINEFKQKFYEKIKDF